jgi:hypothetical protein
MSLLLALSATVVLPVLAADPPKGARITSVKWSEGAGCPTGSWSTAVNTEKHYATLIFDSFLASLEATPGTDDNVSVDCSVIVEVSEIPAGYKAVLDAITWRGYSALRKGANGTWKMTTAWSEGSVVSLSSKDIFFMPRMVAAAVNLNTQWAKGGSLGAGEEDLLLDANRNDAEKTKYGSRCTPAGSGDRTTTVTVGMEVLLGRDDDNVEALAAIDSLDFTTALRAC